MVLIILQLNFLFTFLYKFLNVPRKASLDELAYNRDAKEHLRILREVHMNYYKEI